MSQINSTFYTEQKVINAHSKTRSSFIKKTYLHLSMAILIFMGFSSFLYYSGIGLVFSNLIFSNTFSIVFFLISAVGISTLATNWAYNSNSKINQYLGLFIYAILESFIAIPLILRAVFIDSSLILYAAVMTLTLFLALTVIAFINQTNFSFLKNFLLVGGVVSAVIVVIGLLFGFSLGIWFSGAMILFAAGAILYETSNVLHHYNSEQHVAAALSLFAFITLLFFYILRFLIQFSRD